MDTNNRGTVTVETAIVFPIMAAVLIFGYACMQLCIDYFKTSIYFYKTADQLSDYAYIYHEKFISEFSDTARKDVETEAGNKMDDLLEGIPEYILDIVDIKGYASEYLSGFLDKAEDQLYIPIALGLFHYNKGNEDLNLKSTDFNESEFFHENGEIKQVLECTYEFKVPFFKNDGVNIRYKIRTNGWINGIGKEENNESDIWELNNFERGRKIRKLYGANLPDNFPVISIYKDGKASMIKSLDFRKDTYLQEDAVYNTVSNMMKKLSEYDGQNKPFGKDKIKIKRSDIRQKELILVIPNVEQNDLIANQLEKIEKESEIYGIILSIKKL